MVTLPPWNSLAPDDLADRLGSLDPASNMHPPGCSGVWNGQGEQQNAAKPVAATAAMQIGLLELR